MKLIFLIVNLILISFILADNSNESVEEESPEQMEYYKYLVKRLKQSADSVKSLKSQVPPQIYEIPGPFEPLPGRSHNSDYWPVFPFSNQYSGAVDLDPSISRVSFKTKFGDFKQIFSILVEISTFRFHPGE